MPLNWNISKEDYGKVRKIVDRAKKEFEHLFPVNSTMRANLEMDIIATHLNGNPLDLDKLLSADMFNFTHDIVGISKHLDRTTGQLTDCFLPRCSQREVRSCI